MKTRIKLAGAFIAATALLLPALPAGAAIGNASAAFTGAFSLDTLNVKCLPGDATGRLTTRLRVGLNSASVGSPGYGILGNSTKIVARWPGGSATLTRLGRMATLGSSVRFPCPANNGDLLEVAFQPYRGSRAVGVRSVVNVALNWSGPRVVRQFAGLTGGTDVINLTPCVPGRTPYARLVNAFSVSATHNVAGIPVAELGDDLNRRVTKIVASWPQGSATIRRYDSAVTVAAGSKFPCVNPLVPSSRDLTITYRAYVGSHRVGKAAVNTIRLAMAGDPATGGTGGPVLSVADVPVSTGNGAVDSGDTLETAVTTPNGGPVNIAETSPPTGDYSAPSGWGFFGGEVVIDAPSATAGDPIKIRFLVWSPSTNLAAFDVFRNGVLVPNCTAPTGTTAAPDPCVVKTKVGDTLIADIRTSEASTWNFGQETGNPSQ